MIATIRLSNNVKIEEYKTIVLPMVLYGREIWSLTLKGEYWLKVRITGFLGYRLYTDGFWEQGSEEEIWTEEGWSDGRVEKTV
jgi:hypothetical protein